MSVEYLISKHRCQNEDSTGRLCKYGVGHKAPCRFTPYTPSEAQYAVLEDAARVAGVRRRVCVGTSEVSSMKALHQRGYVTLRYIASRAWDVTLTGAGRDLLIDRAR